MKFETPRSDPDRDAAKYAPAKGGTILVRQAPTRADMLPKAPARHELLVKDGERERDSSFQAEKALIAFELMKRCVAGEVFKFPGIRPGAYNQMKKDWEEAPDYVTNVDELISRFNKEGMKVVFMGDPFSGNIGILPAGSDDPSDSLLPRLLDPNTVTDDTLLELITMEYFHKIDKDRQYKKD